MSGTYQIGDDGPCGICGSSSTEVMFEAVDRLSATREKFQIVRCLHCTVLRTLPAMSEAELGSYYGDEYWGTEPTEQWIQRSQAEKLKFLKANGPSGGSLLDVGCGAGYFLRALDKRAWKLYAIETGKIAAAMTASYLPSGRVHEGSILDCAFPPESFDVITFWSSLEHTNEPRRSLEAAHRLLKQDGKLIIQVPNAGGYQLRLFKGNWFALDAPRHRFHFSEQSIGNLLTGSGFTIETISSNSKEHNLHALRQSMKSSFRRIPYLLLKPFTWPIDTLLSKTKHGATLTLSAAKS